MRKQYKVGWFARRWHCLVWVRWQRWVLGPVAVLYFRRVTFPVRFWLACGAPQPFRPRLPWWQPLLLVLLRLLGGQPGRF